MAAEEAVPLDAWTRAGVWLDVAVQKKPRPWWERAGRIVLAVVALPVLFLLETPEAAIVPAMAWNRYRVLLRTRTDQTVLRTWDMGGDGSEASDLAVTLRRDLERLDVDAFGREWNIEWRPD